MSRSPVLFAALASLIFATCACRAPSTPVAVVPTLERAQAEKIAVLADEIERAVMAGRTATALADVFRGQALEVLRAQAQQLAERGLRIEERNVMSRLVFFDQRASEGVLAVTGSHRLVARDDPAPAWASTARQWWMRFGFQSGAWWIVDQQDLRPDHWRVPAAP